MDTPMTDPEPRADAPQQRLDMRAIDYLHRLLGRLIDVPDHVAKILQENAVYPEHIPVTYEDTSKILDLRQEIESLKGEKELHLKREAGFKNQIAMRDREIAGLKGHLKDKEDALDEKHKLLVEKEQKIRELQVELDTSSQNASGLRAIILQNAGTQNVSDSQLIAKFTSIRRRIEFIVRLPAYRMDTFLVREVETLSAQQRELFDVKAWARWSREDRTRRVTSKMFELIYIRALGIPLFGVEGMVIGGNTETKGGSLWAGLRDFEAAMVNRQLDHKTISSWIISTIECADKMGPLTNYVAECVSKEIYNFFAPLLERPIQRSQEEDLRSKLQDLCREAIELRITMRRSKDRYSFEIPGTRGWSNMASKCEELAEPWAVDGGRPKEASHEIAYTLFGGLVKWPTDGDGKAMVLEKAWVVMKKKT